MLLICNPTDGGWDLSLNGIDAGTNKLLFQQVDRGVSQTYPMYYKNFSLFSLVKVAKVSVNNQGIFGNALANEIPANKIRLTYNEGSRLYQLYTFGTGTQHLSSVNPDELSYNNVMKFVSVTANELGRTLYIDKNINNTDNIASTYEFGYFKNLFGGQGGTVDGTANMTDLGVSTMNGEMYLCGCATALTKEQSEVLYQIIMNFYNEVNVA